MKRLLFLFFFISVFSFSQEEKRLALVIGNSNYDKGELKNPVNDALLIAETLKKLDFDVILKTNIPDKSIFVETVMEFGDKRTDYDIAFVYYAGHGVQVGADNYLLPTKVDFQKETDVRMKALNVQDIMMYLTGMTDLVNILILDACRDNPFEGNWNQTRSVKGGGLAKIPPPAGSLIAFSTDAGKTAADGDGKNSIYCESLSNNLLKANTEINQVFKNVRTEVLDKTDGRQSPVENSKLTGDAFYLLTEKDYNKIELKKLQKEAEEEKNKGNIAEAINKYTILEIYFKGNMQNIDKEKLRKVYMDMGDIYINMQETEPNKYYEEKKANDAWNEDAYNEYVRLHQEYLINSSNAFLNAKLLFDDIELDNIKDKEDYSEVFYKYLREQSYIDYEADKLDYKNFVSLINELNNFNEENFGFYNYRTACSYYLKGIFCNYKEPLVAYNSLVQSSDIFSNIEYDIDKISDYSISLNPAYPSKWTLLTFNNMMNEAFDEDFIVDENKAKEVAKFLKLNINKNVDSLYNAHINIIEDGINISKSNNNEDLPGILNVAKSFTHTFPIIFDVDIDMQKKCTYATIEYRNASLPFAESHRDSINVLYQNVITYRNLSYSMDSKNTEQLDDIEKIIHQSNNDSWKLSLNHKDISYLLRTFNQYMELYYYSNDDSLYSYISLMDKINNIDNLFSEIVQVYRKEDHPYELEEYIKNMDFFINKNKLQEKEINIYKRHKEIYSILFPEEEE